MGQTGVDERLVAAVTDGDAEAVRALLAAGADPGARTGEGLPVLCAAVAAHDAGTALALVEGGADPDQELPDGTTPLGRAVEGGSPAVFEAVLGTGPRLRQAPPARERLLGLARRWHGTGAEAGLRCATGTAGPARTLLVEDSEDRTVEQVTLGGRTVRDGHGAILTALEWAFRVLTPVDELVERAVASPYASPDHVAWCAARGVLTERRSRETWAALAAYRHHPDPARRLFAVDVLWRTAVFQGSHRNSYAKDTAGLLAEWAPHEPDAEVLTRILDTYNHLEHPGHERLGLLFADHPHPPVRAEAACALAGEEARSSAARAALLGLARDPDARVRAMAGDMLARTHDLTPEVTDALLALVADRDDEVRGRAAAALAGSRDRSPAAAAALWGLLDEDDPSLRLEGAFGLALRDDPRTEEAYRRAGPSAGTEFEHDHRPTQLLHYRWRARDRSADAET
ncbi:HEAT repeat domain-containing protein [Streptomyces sp. NPDC008121]|uniref:HEAT repeat domain-containing protein n=1 Tax=Streptomyces sp. NPDC008121 TaxID=3364809 RepID=UPI0036E9FD5C